MAKYGVTKIAGGGGIGSDEVSVTKEYVLNGKPYVGSDTDDEIGIGKMVNNGTTANQSLNAGNSINIKKGYHAQDFTVTANSLASQTSATALTNEIIGGKTAWVNGKKITGTIPIQNADTDGDRVWATNASNWAGTFNVGVRNGYYLNGVNWVRYDVPTFRPENIKKGVNIGGVIGTWEGWVPTPQDLYLTGNNYARWYTDYNTGAEDILIFDSGQITYEAAWKKSLDIKTTNTINLAGYSKLICEGSFNFQTGVQAENSASMRIYYTKDLGKTWTQIGVIYLSQFTTHTYVEIPFTPQAITYPIRLVISENFGNLGGRVNGSIRRIRLS